ncbi:hypothetical protein CBS147326_9421 [Penicillium roqueforti]|nr:hypothetical protein CBS147326_9421 [Penicillium roqueforti]
MAAHTSPPSRLDWLREALTRPNQALKPQQPSQVAEFYPPPTEDESHHEESDKTCSETGDDPVDENQEDGNWETDSLGVYEPSRPSTDAHKKWDDVNLPAIATAYALAKPAKLSVTRRADLFTAQKPTGHLSWPQP